MDDNTEINKLLVKATAVFTENFPNQKPSVAGVAPGRVNLIGEHTDYNEGLVFPMVSVLHLKKKTLFFLKKNVKFQQILNK